MRVRGKNMAFGMAAAIPAMLAGAVMWNRMRDKEDELFLEEFETPEDPRFTYDGTA